LPRVFDVLGQDGHDQVKAAEVEEGGDADGHEVARGEENSCVLRPPGSGVEGVGFHAAVFGEVQAAVDFVPAGAGFGDEQAAAMLRGLFILSTAPAASPAAAAALSRRRLWYIIFLYSNLL
jgi:hypothetical protein